MYICICKYKHSCLRVSLIIFLRTHASIYYPCCENGGQKIHKNNRLINTPSQINFEKEQRNTFTVQGSWN